MNSRTLTRSALTCGLYILVVALMAPPNLMGQITIDFTDPATATFGTNAQYNNNSLMMMWAGDANGDGQILYLGGTDSDIGVLSLAVFTNPSNSNFESDFPLNGVYHSGDLNLQ